MHDNALTLMSQHINRIRDGGGRNALDVGSRDINGTFRPMIVQRRWAYTGIDICAGNNVDVVAEQPYNYPFDDGQFDIVMCGNMLHNCAEPWRLIPEMVRVLVPGGLLVAVTHTWGKPQSGRYPADLWRFMEDGVKQLFDLTGQLHNYCVEYSGEQDIAGSAFKL